MSKRVGAIEIEKVQAASMVKDGASLEDVKKVFKNVEPEYWDRVFDPDLLEMAGKESTRMKEAKAAAEAEAKAKSAEPKKKDPLA
jgi:hypothetical protein